MSRLLSARARPAPVRGCSGQSWGTRCWGRAGGLPPVAVPSAMVVAVVVAVVRRAVPVVPIVFVYVVVVGTGVRDRLGNRGRRRRRRRLRWRWSCVPGSGRQGAGSGGAGSRGARIRCPRRGRLRHARGRRPRLRRGPARDLRRHRRRAGAGSRAEYHQASGGPTGCTLRGGRTDPSRRDNGGPYDAAAARRRRRRRTRRRCRRGHRRDWWLGTLSKRVRDPECPTGEQHNQHGRGRALGVTSPSGRRAVLSPLVLMPERHDADVSGWTGSHLGQRSPCREHHINDVAHQERFINHARVVLDHRIDPVDHVGAWGVRAPRTALRKAPRAMPSGIGSSPHSACEADAGNRNPDPRQQTRWDGTGDSGAGGGQCLGGRRDRTCPTHSCRRARTRP